MIEHVYQKTVDFIERPLNKVQRELGSLQVFTLILKHKTIVKINVCSFLKPGKNVTFMVSKTI